MSEWKDIRGNLLAGYFNGLIFSGSWAFFYGPLTQYKPQISTKEFFIGIRKYTSKSLIRLSPMCAMARALSDYLENKGYQPITTLSCTFIFCVGYLYICKFP